MMVMAVLVMTIALVVVALLTIQVLLACRLEKRAPKSTIYKSAFFNRYEGSTSLPAYKHCS